LPTTAGSIDLFFSEERERIQKEIDEIDGV
jgi:hypothetical protein